MIDAGEGYNTIITGSDADGGEFSSGDGLMVIRHLFGTAFQGESLTDKALSDDSPYWDDPEPWVPVANNIDALM